MMSKLKDVLMNEERPSEYFEHLRANDLLDKDYHELKALIGVPQNREHHLEGDAWTHTMLVVDEAAKRRDIVVEPFGFMLSALCHDLGKAVCTTVSDDGTVHSYNHEVIGLPVVEAFLSRFTDDQRLKDYVLNMTELHMEPNIMASARSKLKKTNKLFDSSVEPFDLIQLAVCDGLGKIPKCDDTEEFLIERFELFREIMARPHLEASDLVKAGFRPCVEFREILKYAHKLRLAGLSKEDQLRQSIAYARTILRR